MFKTEIILVLLFFVVLGLGIWFIFSEEIWAFVSLIETMLYPTIVTPN